MATKVSKHHITITGAKELSAKLKILGMSAELQLGKALYKEATNIMSASKAIFVPVQDGPLRASGHVQFPKPGPLVEMGYGGPSVPYALIQHENPDYKHTVGTDKYLERPLTNALPGMPKRIGIMLRVWIAKHGVK